MDNQMVDAYSHVMDLDGIVHNLQDGLILIRPQILAYRRRHAIEMVPCVCHRKFLNQVGALDPGGEVDDLFAIEVYDTEVLALLHRECKSMGGRHDVRLW